MDPLVVLAYRAEQALPFIGMEWCPGTAKPRSRSELADECLKFVTIHDLLQRVI